MFSVVNKLLMRINKFTIPSHIYIYKIETQKMWSSTATAMDTSIKIIKRQQRLLYTSCCIRKNTTRQYRTTTNYNININNNNNNSNNNINPIFQSFIYHVGSEPCNVTNEKRRMIHDRHRILTLNNNRSIQHLSTDSSYQNRNVIRRYSTTSRKCDTRKDSAKTVAAAIDDVSTKNNEDHLDSNSSNNDTEDNSNNYAISDEWIPPNRPLVGDVGQAHLYAHIEDDKELHQLLSEDNKIDTVLPKATTTTETNAIDAELIDASSIDWLKTRRNMMSGQMMMKPDDATWYKESMVDNELPIIEHTLYSEKELVQCIQALGGQDVQVILDQGGKGSGNRRRLGKDVRGIIIVTGNNFIQMQQIAQHIVRQLRRRNLQQVGVIGAELGVDGNMNDPNENWYAIDCGNYIVHIQDTVTRTAVNLAGLWTGNDPIRTVDCTNEDAVEDYVAQYPVPSNYTVGGTIPLSQLYNIPGISSHSGSDWDRTTIKQFEKGRFGTRTSTLINANTRNGDRKSAAIPRRKKSGRKT